MKRTLLAAGALALIAGASQAIVVPNANAGVEGDGTFALTSTGTAGRTYQLTIAANQLTGVVGTQITALQFRLNGAATTNWPAASASFAAWDIYMGPGVAPSSMSNTFASNFSGPATQVRSGGITFNPGDFSIGGSPNNFGVPITFNTPYNYAGGDLTIELRFTQQVGTTTQSPIDAVAASGGPGNGWGVDFAGRWTGNYTGTTGSNGNFLVTNLVVIPAPSAMALAGLSMLVAGRRRR